MNLRHDAGILPRGFEAAGISAKIKKSGKKDLALFYSQAPCVAAALFTDNRIKAAPIAVCQKHLKAGPMRALIANSGNANCMTGSRGRRDALAMAAAAAKHLSVRPQEVLVASTGIIGRFLPAKKIQRAMPELVGQLDPGGISAAAQALMTTDTRPKEVCVAFGLNGSRVTLSGVAKGAGMIAPRLKSATMLSFLFTDAAISKKALGQALHEAVERSFNAITIDGCMSTNDTVAVLANGMAKNKMVTPGSKALAVFRDALDSVCLELAQAMVRDAEGATKCIEILVRGARRQEAAKRFAFQIANSNLFKCAMFGNDPNWGRIAAALGSAALPLDWKKMGISINGRPVFGKGGPLAFEKQGLLRGRAVRIEVDLRQGNAFFCVYTSDLSYDYVKINAEYN